MIIVPMPTPSGGSGPELTPMQWLVSSVVAILIVVEGTGFMIGLFERGRCEFETIGDVALFARPLGCHLGNFFARPLGGEREPNPW